MELLKYYWTGSDDAFKVFVYYDSITSWNHVILAIVNLATEDVELLKGNNQTDRTKIANFRTEAFSGIGRFKQLHANDVSVEFIKHANEILNKHCEEDDFKLMCLHINSDDIHYAIVDTTKLTYSHILSLIISKYKMIYQYGDDRHQYYCGITNDLDTRMEAHRNGDFSIVDNQVYAWNCDSLKVAAKVEEQLGKLGFDIGNVERGGNGGSPDSTIVYLIKKGNIVNH